MAYRKNPTDRSQNELEAAANDGGITVHTGGKQRMVGSGVHTAPLKTNHGSATGSERSNAGVVISPSDRSGVFEQPGKTRWEV